MKCKLGHKLQGCLSAEASGCIGSLPTSLRTPRVGSREWRGGHELRVYELRRDELRGDGLRGGELRGEDELI